MTGFYLVALHLDLDLTEGTHFKIWNGFIRKNLFTADAKASNIFIKQGY